MVNSLDQRIAELEALIAPLQTELKQLRRQRAVTRANIASVQTRGIKKQERDAAIQKALQEQAQELLYKRGSGLIRTIAAQFGVSERTVARIYANTRPAKNKSVYVKVWS